MKVILATTNSGKVKEFSTLLNDERFELSCIQDGFNCPENGKTFLDNANQKAIMAAEITKCYSLADDSGLCIEALEGAPGIYSARYFEKGEGMKKILALLEHINNRRAYFVCALALADPAGNIIWQTEAKWHGEIAKQAKGTNGFGYDPIFIPNDLKLTAAELDPEIKTKLSHRGKAVSAFREHLASLRSSVL